GGKVDACLARVLLADPGADEIATSDESGVVGYNGVQHYGDRCPVPPERRSCRRPAAASSRCSWVRSWLAPSSTRHHGGKCYDGVREAGRSGTRADASLQSMGGERGRI